jgi:hypothetical protein
MILMMEMKNYHTPTVKVTSFEVQDIITLSVTDSVAVDVTAGWMEDEADGMS